MNIHNALPLLCAAALAASTSAQRAPDLAAPVLLKAGGEVIDTGEYIGHAGPLFADFDGDGTRDLLVGNFKGYFQLYGNTGTNKEPVFEAKGLLQAGGADAYVHNW